MKTTVNIHEAKTHLSRLLHSVASGDEVVIAKNGVPVARLVPAESTKVRTPGRFSGQIHGVDSLLEPLPSEESVLWSEGHPDDPLKHASPSDR